MHTLAAGYWLGEFGWELMRWQAHIRHLAKDYDRVIIGCEKGHEFLYEDFATEFKIWDKPIPFRNVCYCGTQGTFPIETEEGWKRIVPKSDICAHPDLEQDFIKWGKWPTEAAYDIVIHARASNNLRTGYRNWPIEHWEWLVDKLKTWNIASIGTEAHHIKGTEDKRNISLKKLADIMANANACVGPSSGPMHLGALCGTSLVVWSDIKREYGVNNNRERYKVDWNPFEVPVTFIEAERWKADPELVLEAVEKYL